MAYGSILEESTDPHEARKVRGAFFTPPKLASFLCSAAIRSVDDTVLEPSCGEGEFVEAALERLVSLGGSSDQASNQVQGFELHEATAHAALQRLGAAGFSPRIDTGDFFFVEPVRQFDAVVGNPPYIRYQEFVGAQRAKAREDALRAGVRVDALASSWAPFMVHAVQFLKVGGRLALVLPAELLTTNYAAPVRQFLLQSFSDIHVVLFDEPVFPEVQEEVVLLVAEGYQQGASGCVQMQQVRSLLDMGGAEEIPVSVAEGERWPIGRMGSEAHEFLDELVPDMLTTLDTWGRVKLGAVTGNNRFFSLSDASLEAWGLSQSDVLPLCPPGSRHLRRLTLTSDDLKRLSAQGKATNLFYPSDLPSEAARSYIQWGEQRHVDESYKCRIRSPWWHVPGVEVCDIFFTYMNGNGPNLCLNQAAAVHLNSVHGIYLSDEARELGRSFLPIVALSTCTLLSAEIVGRSYGGGILKLEPREAAKILVPTQKVAAVHADRLAVIKDEVEKELVEGNAARATDLVDDVLMGDDAQLRASLEKMKSLLHDLRKRRLSRGKKAV